MTGDPVAWLEAEFGRVEELARAAANDTGEEWTDCGEYGEDVMVRDSNTYVAVGPYGCGLTDGARYHIAQHDPVSVLRRVNADRALLADLLAERHEVVDGDCWYTCVAATEERDGGENCDDDRRGGPCDCGRDARVGRRVRLLAEAWGWEETG